MPVRVGLNKQGDIHVETESTTFWKYPKKVLTGKRNNMKEYYKPGLQMCIAFVRSQIYSMDGKPHFRKDG